MNKKITAVIIILSTFFSFSQSRTEHYVLPKFTDGLILMKNGEKRTGVLNYNALAERMILKTNGRMAPLEGGYDNPVDTVYVDNRKFVNKGGKYSESLINSKVLLEVDYYCALKTNVENRNAYGSSSQTGSSAVAADVLSQGSLYKLQLPPAYIAELKLRYQYVKNGEESVINSLRQIRKLYPDFKKEFDSFKKSYKVDFEDVLAVARLIDYLESLD